MRRRQSAIQTIAYASGVVEATGLSSPRSTAGSQDRSFHFLCTGSVSREDDEKETIHSLELEDPMHYLWGFHLLAKYDDCIIQHTKGINWMEEQSNGVIVLILKNLAIVLSKSNRCKY